MCNKVKSEHFAMRSANRVAVFQAILKLASEEAGSQLYNKDNKQLTSHG